MWTPASLSPRLMRRTCSGRPLAVWPATGLFQLLGQRVGDAGHADHDRRN